MPENPADAPQAGQPATELANRYADRTDDPSPVYGDPGPLPVHIVNPPQPAGDDVSDSWGADQVLVDGGGAGGNAHLAPVRIVERQADRIRVTLLNTDTADTVYLFPRNEGTQAIGFPLAPGASITIKTRAAVYARIGAGLQALVAVLPEYRAQKATD